ncbi:TraR/DksA family transcriptional regulator [Metabacillus arenae]|uniref:TraR/DksA family transcriptional regulator n=1 Tax=Metabacillus arenae TaxID=2771434 RepID=A0A926RVQ8_9BACI|nr:TraR/DksA family transcriptional regulator [Metabacillus arenae]MBD1379953.1 TraR/DksA family transcriptional regulator [Metabacillus arenae]
MPELLASIRYELELMREELTSRLFEHSLFDMEVRMPQVIMSIHQEKTLLFHIKEELQDVEYALKKMDEGCYGICELTSEPIPLDKLRIIPTARTIYDFSYQEQFERKCLSLSPEYFNSYSYH